MFLGSFIASDFLLAVENPWHGGQAIITTSLPLEALAAFSNSSLLIVDMSELNTLAFGKFNLNDWLANLLISTATLISKPACLKPSAEPPQPENRSMTFNGLFTNLVYHRRKLLTNNILVHYLPM